MSSTSGILLLLGLVVVAAVKLEIPKIHRLKQQSELLSAQNPSNAPLCFEYYRPRLDNIAQQYEVQYTYCNTEYAEQTALEDSKWQEPRQSLVSSGKYSCDLIADCSTIVGYVEAFECFARVGADESKSMYEISTNATQTSFEIKNFYRQIESTKTICINNAEQAYVKDTSVTYEALNDCLSGKSPLTTEDYDSSESTTEIYWDTTI
ncbi:uncharacterized protein LOC115765074 [Drosophila novamexicana]|uniref:uncharacterized protein LOC115765074 n=1 Tax=Drosophila novamexicana TaxID=47314 RepID=UPI0011E5F820|nr:uncharacterized protein LOC115765074 [Drosophila novamexicana]